MGSIKEVGVLRSELESCKREVGATRRSLEAAKWHHAAAVTLERDAEKALAAHLKEKHATPAEPKINEEEGSA